ncbi:MAG: AraC family ligand binding domain-containing protein, partial [Corynebacterium sp.]|nr:AraC family ligand binding domain-containing protein [Corynebacterium sp.]
MGTLEENRSLPVYRAGELSFGVRAFGRDEVLDRDTTWGEHAHPTHELLWNERGAATATIDRRVWTITPGVGLWIPAGTLHSGFTASGVWHRAAQFSTTRVTPPAQTP